MKKKSLLFIILILLQSHMVLPFPAGNPIGFTGPVYNGPELDYQPSIIRVDPGGDLMMIFERINPQSFVGDFFITFSTNNSRTWSLPQEILPSALNRRHPSLVQLPDHTSVLFYLQDETGSGDYRIHRATSPDGTSWSAQGALDLGWAAAGEINPAVICESDGMLTMTYHRLYGPDYIARSADSGATWDTLKTQISNGNAALPRLAKREHDGLYLVTYQTGSSNLDLWAKITTDPYNWSGDTIPVSTAINSHDSQPIVLEDGTFLVPFARQIASVFDVYYVTSPDGEVWSDAVRVTSDTGHYDTQPHPLLQGTPGHVILAWSHQDSPGPYQDHDVWIHTDLGLSFPPPDHARIVTGPGPGPANAPLVRIFDPESTTSRLTEWLAYGVQMYGVNVACGNLHGSGSHMVITSPGPGAVFGPHVRAFTGLGHPLPGVNFIAYGTRKFGVHVRCGNLKDDGMEEIISGPGPGVVFAAHVRGWDYDGMHISAMPGVNYFAYPPGSFRYGVLTGAVDLDGDEMDEILTIPGPVQPAVVRGWNVDGGTAVPINTINFSPYGDMNLFYGGTIAGGFF